MWCDAELIVLGCQVGRVVGEAQVNVGALKTLAEEPGGEIERQIVEREHGLGERFHAVPVVQDGLAEAG